MRIYWKEFFGHSSTIVMSLVALLCLIAIVPEMGSWVYWVAMVAGAVLFFTTEYTTHRFLFHMPPPKNEKLL
ncbi:MAG: hypothetical protein WCC10_00110, partial [Tumebacillaceae bacterium]